MNTLTLYDKEFGMWQTHVAPRDNFTLASLVTNKRPGVGINLVYSIMNSFGETRNF